MPDQYTHNIKFETGDYFIRGDAEFNTDGKASFKIDEWSQPLPLDVIKMFHKLMKYVQVIYKSNGGIKKIIIKKKE